MNVTIYQLAHSPFCIPITQALTALGVPFETREVPNWDRAEIIRLTGGASYEVPLLVHEQRPIYESRADSLDVARYVDAQWGRGRLFPEALSAPHRCTIDFLENEVEARTFKLNDIHSVPAIDDLVGRTMTLRHKERRFGRGCVDHWRAGADAIRAEADALLERFNATLQHQPFLFGNTPIYADFLLFGMLGNLLWKGRNVLNPSQATLGEWQERMRGFRFNSLE